MSLIHERFVEMFAGELSSSIAGEPEFPYDGIKVRLKNKVDLSIVYPGESEYIFQWEKDGINYRIDTAPLHKGLSTSPNHFHRGDEKPEADPVTSTSKKPEENLKAIVAFILGK